MRTFLGGSGQEGEKSIGGGHAFEIGVLRENAAAFAEYAVGGFVLVLIEKRFGDGEQSSRAVGDFDVAGKATGAVLREQFEVFIEQSFLQQRARGAG